MNIVEKEQDTSTKPHPAVALNEKLRKEINRSLHTHVALINFNNLESAAMLRQRVGAWGDLSVITDTTTTHTIAHENIILGEQIQTNDGSTRYHCTSEAIVNTSEEAHHHGILLMSSRKMRRLVEKAIGGNLKWATKQEALKHLDFIDDKHSETV
jgi:hypothetical protein